ncbi:MAG: ATP-binding protein [Firmicutes bacterium]|nr:ATP-binding protein [Bacillota bacterium]
MKKYRLKITIIILTFCLCMTGITGVLSVEKSNEYLTTEIENKLKRSAEKNAYEVSAHLNHMVGLVDSILANVETNIDEDRLYGPGSEAYVKEFVNSQGEFIKNCLETSNNAHSLYLVMEPNLTEYPVEVWYKTDKKGEVTQLFVNPEKKKKDLTDESMESMAYFFKARDEKNDGVWTGLYFDDDLNENLFSYSRSIYVGDKFIGVVGSDIVADDTKALMDELKLYEDSNAAIFDGDYGYVITPDTEKEQTDALAKALRKAKGSSGVFTYDVGDEEYIAGFAVMENRWIVATTQPSDQVFIPVERTSAVMTSVAIIVGILLLIFLMGLSTFFSRRESALERENREKDILLSYHVRRANVGEMVGNVAHQWKQPLNTINLILANLLDSYKYGDFDEATLTGSVHKIENITDKMACTISDFSGFLKPADGKMNDYNVVECIEGAVSLMEEDLSRNKINVSLDCIGDMDAYGYGNELQHVIFNVLDNARDAVVASRETDRNIAVDAGIYGDTVRIRIQDNGSGMPSYIASNAFEPYFTTKEDNGTGLGLYICRNIVENRMKGTISIENTNIGALCTITFPRKLAGKMNESNS